MQGGGRVGMGGAAGQGLSGKAERGDVDASLAAAQALTQQVSAPTRARTYTHIDDARAWARIPGRTRRWLLFLERRRRRPPLHRPATPRRPPQNITEVLAGLQRDVTKDVTRDVTRDVMREVQAFRLEAQARALPSPDDVTSTCLTT